MTTIAPDYPWWIDPDTDDPTETSEYLAVAVDNYSPSQIEKFYGHHWRNASEVA